MILRVSSLLPAAPPQTGPWAQAQFGLRVSGVRPGSEAAEQGAWGVSGEARPGRTPSGPPSSGGHPGAVVSVFWVPAVVGHSLLVSGVPTVMALNHCDGVL